jgi:hypothetical protein
MTNSSLSNGEQIVYYLAKLWGCLLGVFPLPRGDAGYGSQVESIDSTRTPFGYVYPMERQFAVVRPSRARSVYS